MADNSTGGKSSAPTKPIINEIATAAKDIDVFAGWLNRLENPDPILRTESAGKGMKLYDEVNRDPHAGAVLQSRCLAVAGCEWEVTPADDSQQAVEIAGFVDDALKRINFTQAVAELMQAVLYGFFVAEVMWVNRNGAWIPTKIIGKNPRRFVFGMDRGLRLLTPANMVDGEPVPDRKFICFTYGSSDNPYGSGLGQKLWWPVWFKKHGIKYWLVFLEKFGMPTTWGKYPAGTDPADQGKLLDAIDAMQNETGVTTPDTMQLELLEATRTGNATYETMCNYMDRQISKASLGQTASTEGTPGKLGNEDSQEQVRMELKKADADLVAEVLNNTIVPWIVDYNMPGVTEYPKLWFRTNEEQDLKPLAERDQILTDIGLPVPESYFYDTYGIPKPEGDEPVIKVAGRDSNPGIAPGMETRPASDGRASGNAREFAESSLFPDQTAIDRMAPPDAGVMDPVLKPVMDLIREGNSYEEIEDKLLEQYPDMNATEAEKLMERAIFISELWGRLNA